MNLVPKEILMSHLKRSEGAEEVSLPIDFFRDLVYQAMPRAWVGLTEEEKKNIFLKWYGKHWAYTSQLQSVMDSVEAKLKENNNG
jgi:hypothetical protein